VATSRDWAATTGRVGCRCPLQAVLYSTLPGREIVLVTIASASGDPRGLTARVGAACEALSRSRKRAVVGGQLCSSRSAHRAVGAAPHEQRARANCGYHSGCRARSQPCPNVNPATACQHVCVNTTPSTHIRTPPWGLVAGGGTGWGEDSKAEAKGWMQERSWSGGEGRAGSAGGQLA